MPWSGGRESAPASGPGEDPLSTVPDSHVTAFCSLWSRGSRHLAQGTQSPMLCSLSAAGAGLEPRPRMLRCQALGVHGFSPRGNLWTPSEGPGRARVGCGGG